MSAQKTWIHFHSISLCVFKSTLICFWVHFVIHTNCPSHRLHRFSIIELWKYFINRFTFKNSYLFLIIWIEKVSFDVKSKLSPLVNASKVCTLERPLITSCIVEYQSIKHDGHMIWLVRYEPWKCSYGDFLHLIENTRLLLGYVSYFSDFGHFNRFLAVQCFPKNPVTLVPWFCIRRS